MGLYARYLFPRLLDAMLGTPEFGRYRQQALAPARGRVLEIGFGTGLNLAHYPATVRELTVIDTENLLPARVAARIRACAIPVIPMQLDAQGRLPFADESFDSVVSTLTLCSIDRADAALAEVRRVLRADGQFVFFEHGRSDDARIAQRQDRFNWLQRILGCGCNMNRPMDQLIRAAGFALPALDRFLMPDAPRVLAEMYRGVAVISE